MERFGEVVYFSSSPQPLYHHQESIMAAENSFFYQFQDRPQQNWYDESQEESSCSSMNDDDDEEEDALERFLKKLDGKGHEIIKKLVSKNVPLEQVFRGKPAASRILEKMARKVGLEREREGGFVRRERGLDVGVIMQEELKNERFKVKAMNIVGSGVVEEEERRS